MPDRPGVDALPADRSCMTALHLDGAQSNATAMQWWRDVVLAGSVRVHSMTTGHTDGL